MIYEKETYSSRVGRWRPWFAWHPVRVTDTHKVWWQTILRRSDKNAVEFEWEYKLS